MRTWEKVWTAQHGWLYLHAIIDCCTRELVGWSLELRFRDDEAIACVEAAVLTHGVTTGTLTLGGRCSVSDSSVAG
jgi:putative transposase